MSYLSHLLPPSWSHRSRGRSLHRVALGCVTILLLCGMLSARADALLFDLGADATPTIPSGGGQPVFWNNVDAFLGSFEESELAGLVNTTGDSSAISLVILSRFNGANENGTTAFPDFPASATRDSLFGNTEEFSGLEDIFPRFKLTGLEAGTVYHLSFYASRLGVSDNREPRYTVTLSGSSEVITIAQPETEYFYRAVAP